MAIKPAAKAIRKNNQRGVFPSFIDVEVANDELVFDTSVLLLLPELMPLTWVVSSVELDVLLAEAGKVNE